MNISTVAAIMSQDPVIIDGDQPLMSAVKIFRDNSINQIIVFNRDSIVGLLHKSDFLFFRRGFNDINTDERLDSFRLKIHQVSEIMDKDFLTIGTDVSIIEATGIMIQQSKDALVVLDNNQVKGIVTIHDILRYAYEYKLLNQ